MPDKLMNKITTRARNILIREKILSCEQMLEYYENGINNINGVGIKTVREIVNLKKKIAEISLDIAEHHKGAEGADTAGNDSLTPPHLKPSYPMMDRFTPVVEADQNCAGALDNNHSGMIRWPIGGESNSIKMELS
jgi:hypothetical protein